MFYRCTQTHPQTKQKRHTRVLNAKSESARGIDICSRWVWVRFRRYAIFDGSQETEERGGQVIIRIYIHKTRERQTENKHTQKTPHTHTYIQTAQIHTETHSNTPKHTHTSNKYKAIIIIEINTSHNYLNTGARNQKKKQKNGRMVVRRIWVICVCH